MNRRGIAVLLVFATIAGIFAYNHRRGDIDIMDDEMVFGVPLDSETQRIIDGVSEIESIISKAFKLEDIESINQATMAFIRSKRYGYRVGGMTGLIWEAYAGNLEQETGIDVTANAKTEAEILALADQMSYIYDPQTGDKIDFPHLVAVTDVEYTDMDEEDHLEEYMDYFFSWGGDLETFLLDMNDYSDVSGKTSYKDMYEYAKDTLGTETRSYFSQEDLLADIDGKNIQVLMSERGLLFSEALMQYYSSGSFANREDLFIEAHGGGEEWEAAVKTFILGEIPDAYAGDVDFEAYIESVASMNRLMRVMAYDQKYDPTEESREAAVVAFLEVVQ